MKLTVVGILAFVTSAAPILAFNIGILGERAIMNLYLTPGCAQSCILNSKLVREYAPECANIPLGKEYGTKLCQNYLFQQMLDNCFKETCNDKDRSKARELGKDTCQSFGVDLDLPPW